MFSKKQLIVLFALVPFLWLVGCAQPKDVSYSSPEEYLSDPHACSIIKNSSVRQDNKEAQEFWFGVDQRLVDFTRDQIVLNNHPVKKIIFDPEKNVDSISVVAATMARYKCRRLIQIQHVHNAPAEFGYNVGVLVPNKRADASTGDPVYTLKSVYEKQYRFPLTKETFDKLVVSDLGREIANDILSSKVLSK